MVAPFWCSMGIQSHNSERSRAGALAIVVASKQVPEQRQAFLSSGRKTRKKGGSNPFYVTQVGKFKDCRCAAQTTWRYNEGWLSTSCHG